MRDGIHVRFLGPGIREVPGVGVFQTDTVAFVPREIALEILKEDCFVAVGSGKPVSALVVRLGQASPSEHPPARATPAPLPPPSEPPPQ
jgi:hypothetical protein